MEDMKHNQQPLGIGIDIGGTNTKFGIVNHRGEILYRGAISTRKRELPEEFVEDLYEALLPAIEEAGGMSHFKGIGIGAPNGNFYKGTIEFAPNLLWKGVVNMVDIVRKRFGIPAALTNDANAAAVGEMMYGAARGMKDFIVITLGTGVGSGIVSNGQLILGHDGFAGELGHTIIIPGGRKHWGTDAHGSLEAYCSATGVALTAKEFLENRPEEKSLLRSIPSEELEAKSVFDAAEKGDKLAQDVFAFTGEILGRALANFVMFSSPEAIILFGGLTKAGDLLTGSIRKSMEADLLPIFRNKVKIIISELKEADAAVLGASALVWELK
jgi:glucokinase